MYDIYMYCSERMLTPGVGLRDVPLQLLFYMAFQI